MKRLLPNLLVPIIVLVSAAAYGQTEPPPNHDKLNEVMGRTTGKWKMVSGTRTVNGVTTEVQDAQMEIASQWSLDGQIINSDWALKWTSDTGEPRTLNRQYTYYWDRSDEKIKLVWFSSWGTVRHGLLKNSDGKSLTWEWPIDREDGSKGTVVVVNTLQDEDTIISEQIRTLDDGTELDRGKAVLKRVK